MSKIVEASGTLTIQSDKCVSSQGSTTKQIALGPGNACSGKQYYQAAFQAEPEIATAGAVGDNFEELEVAQDLTLIELLFIRTSAEIALRLYALAATAQATAGTFPTAFAGGETLEVTIDGTLVTTTFLVGDQTAAQCAARINAAMALAGFATPRATVVNGQLLITGVATKVGSGGVGQLTFGGTGAATLGFGVGAPTVVDAQGQDMYVIGCCGPLEFPSTGSNLLTAIEVSGVATLDVLAAGRSQ